MPPGHQPVPRRALPSRGPSLVTPPTVEQVYALTAAIHPPFRALVYVMAGLGLRPSEALGLRVEDIDRVGRVVQVRRQLGEDAQPAPLKTAASSRDVPLPGFVAEAVAEHLLATGVRSGLVFRSAHGGPVRLDAVQEAWRSARKRVKVPTVRLHHLRHFYASLLIAQGESVKVVQRRLGHASATVTLDFYGHLWPDSDDRTGDAVDAVLGASADSVRTEAASSQVTGIDGAFAVNP